MDPTWCPPPLFLAQRPLADENSMDGTALCLGTATTGTKFSMLHDILGVSPDGHE